MDENDIIEPLPESPETVNREMTSDYDPSLNESVLQSLTSTLNEHIYEYGRRYHVYKEGRYPMPNDEQESERESLKHLMVKEVVGGKLHLAPIGENPQKIIDLGTGFGEWAMEVAETYPSAEVVGIDLSPIQPTWVPPNLKFVVDDMEDAWIYKNDFDYVHLRFVGTTIKDLPALIAKIYANLKPGGWIEFQELSPQAGCDDGTVTPNYPLAKFFAILNRVFREHYGFDIRQVDSLPEKLEIAGFTNIQRKTFKLPIGDWARDKHLNMIGLYYRPVLIDSLAAVASKPFAQAGIDEAETDELFHDISIALADRRVHAYTPMNFVWAQKPPA